MLARSLPLIPRPCCFCHTVLSCSLASSGHLLASSTNCARAQELELYRELPGSQEAQALVTYQRATLQYAAGLHDAEATCRTSLALCRQLPVPDAEQVGLSLCSAGCSKFDVKVAVALLQTGCRYGDWARGVMKEEINVCACL